MVDHVAAAGDGIKDTQMLHRIDPAAAKSEIEAAGFVLEAQSDMLRNPDDSHTLRIFGPAIRGKTDKLIFKFRKPAAAQHQSRVTRRLKTWQQWGSTSGEAYPPRSNP